MFQQASTNQTRGHNRRITSARTSLTRTSLTRGRAAFLVILATATCFRAENAACQDQTASSVVSLAWKLAVGDALKLELHQKTDTVTAVGKKLIRVSLEVHSDLNWRVTAVDEGGFSIDQTVTGMSLKMRLPDKEAVLEYDSRSDVTPRGTAKKIADGIKPLLDGKVSFKMDRRGTISDVASDLDDAVGEGGQSDNLRALFTPEVMNEMLAQMFPQLPADKSEKWSASVKRELPLGQVSIATDYSSGASEKDGLTRLTVVGKVSLAAKSDEEKDFVRLKSGDLSGWLDFDHVAGRFASGDVTQVVVAESREGNIPIRTRVKSRLWFTVEY